MNVYMTKEECSGCRACEQICPRQCITMEADQEGFLYPVVNEELCISCGKCKEVCNRIGSKLEKTPIKVFAAKNKNEKVVMHSSSGGAFWELASYTIKEKGRVYGAVYNSDFQVMHIGTDQLDVVKKMCGSKYVQSDNRDSYSEVLRDLRENKIVLYSGTPCQIAGLKSFLNFDYDNLLCMAVVCHGVPSPMVWNKYLAYKEFIQGSIKDVNFRFKEVSGWKNYTINFKSDKGNTCEDHSSELYMRGFVENLYLRPSCHQCRVKGEHIDADIILGDFWGIENKPQNLDWWSGVSAVIINSKKGERLWREVCDKFETAEFQLEDVVEANSALNHSVVKNPNRQRFFQDLSTSNDIILSIRNNLRIPMIGKERMAFLYPSILKYLENKVNGLEVVDFLEQNNFKRIVIYAVTDLSKLLVRDIKTRESNVELLAICDRDYRRFENGVQGFPVIGIEELMSMYNKGQVDAIIVGNLIAENSIIKDLLNRGCSIDRVLSANSIIFSYGDL